MSAFAAIADITRKTKSLEGCGYGCLSTPAATQIKSRRRAIRFTNGEICGHVAREATQTSRYEADS